MLFYTLVFKTEANIMAVAQIIAVAIFVIMFGLIISEKVERHIVTLVAALVLFSAFL